MYLARLPDKRQAVIEQFLDREVLRNQEICIDINMKRFSLKRAEKQGYSVALGLAVLLALLWWLNASQVKSAKLPDFTRISDIPELKTSFFDFLEPLADSANREVLNTRAWLLQLKTELDQGKRPDWFDRRSLKNIADHYGLEDTALTTEKLVEELLQRVDTIPAPLMLVQAAAESGWGRSRFARQGNNLYGEWCYEKGCGLVPKKRSAEARHEVQAFDRPYDSVVSYLHTLNTHPAYRELRQKRQALRNAEAAVTSQALADTLIFYSERRQAYVNEIKHMLRQYRRMMSDDGS